MAASKGALGIIELGASPAVVGELRSWRQPMEVTEIDTTVMGSDLSRFIPGKRRDSVTCDLFFDHDDAGQALVLSTMGDDTATTAVAIYPNGKGTGLPVWNANCYIMGGEVGSDADGAVEFTGVTFSSDENGGAWTTQV